MLTKTIIENLLLVTGISLHSLLFAWGAMSCVLGYALLINAPPLVVGCIQGMIYQLIITKYYYRYRHH